MNKYKKLNSKGFSHVEILLILLVAVVIVGAGFLVYRHDNKKSVAHASSYTALGNAYGVSVSACKTYLGVYGGVYAVTFVFDKTSSTPNREYYIEDTRKGSAISIVHNNAYYLGEVGSETVNANIALHDYIWAGVFENNSNPTYTNASSTGFQVGDISAKYGTPWANLNSC